MKTEVNRGACPGEKKKEKKTHKLQATSGGKQKEATKAATHGIQGGMVAATDWISSDLFPLILLRTSSMASCNSAFLDLSKRIGSPRCLASEGSHLVEKKRLPCEK